MARRGPRARRACRRGPWCRRRRGTAPQRREVLDAQLVGPARRVQRVRQQDQGGGGEAVGDGHRAHAPAHRATAEAEAGGADAGRGHEGGGLLANGVEQHRRPVGGLAPGLAVREVHAGHRERGDPRLDGDRRRVVAVGPGPGRQQQARRTAPARLHPRRMRRAWVRSAMRSAAASVSPPWSGWASRSSWRNRRCTSRFEPSALEPEHVERPQPRVGEGRRRPAQVGVAGEVADQARVDRSPPGETAADHVEDPGPQAGARAGRRSTPRPA